MFSKTLNITWSGDDLDWDIRSIDAGPYLSVAKDAAVPCMALLWKATPESSEAFVPGEEPMRVPKSGELLPEKPSKTPRFDYEPMTSTATLGAGFVRGTFKISIGGARPERFLEDSALQYENIRDAFVFGLALYPAAVPKGERYALSDDGTEIAATKIKIFDRGRPISYWRKKCKTLKCKLPDGRPVFPCCALSDKDGKPLEGIIATLNPAFAMDVGMREDLEKKFPEAAGSFVKDAELFKKRCAEIIGKEPEEIRLDEYVSPWSGNPLALTEEDLRRAVARPFKPC